MIDTVITGASGGPSRPRHRRRRRHRHHRRAGQPPRSGSGRHRRRGRGVRCIGSDRLPRLGGRPHPHGDLQPAGRGHGHREPGRGHRRHHHRAQLRPHRPVLPQPGRTLRRVRPRGAEPDGGPQLRGLRPAPGPHAGLPHRRDARPGGRARGDLVQDLHVLRQPRAARRQRRPGQLPDDPAGRALRHRPLRVRDAGPGRGAPRPARDGRRAVAVDALRDGRDHDRLHQDGPGRGPAVGAGRLLGRPAAALRGPGGDDRRLSGP